MAQNTREQKAPHTRAIRNTSHRTPADIVIFSDGTAPDSRRWISDAETQPRIGWITFAWGPTEEEGQAYCSSKIVPKQLLKQWEPRKTQISTMELLTTVMSIIQLKYLVTGKWVVRRRGGGRPAGETLREDSGFLSFFWNTVEKIDASIYIARVPSDSNPSDVPSRGDYQELQARQAHWVEPRISKDIMKKEYWQTSFTRPEQRTSSRRSSLWPGELSPAQDRGRHRSDVYFSSFGQCPTNLIDTVSTYLFRPSTKFEDPPEKRPIVPNVHSDGLCPSRERGARLVVLHFRGQ